MADGFPLSPPLAQLGLDREQWAAARALDGVGLSLFRVAVEAQAQLALLGPGEQAPVESPIRWAELSGKLRTAQRTDPLARPAVGDFVLAQPSEDGSSWRIEHVLPRRSRFIRQSAKRRLDPQVIAANIDLVGVVTSPNEDFNPRRLERYLATIHASGAQPAIILNKADLTDALEPWLREAQAVALDAPVVAVSAKRGLGLAALEKWLQPGRTVALVGSSGVGKSSLTNALLGREHQRVDAIREGDDKGRHTTTHRELFSLPPSPDGTDRGLLIDTPGMRSLALWAEPEALLGAFADISALGEGCRFRDCRHGQEPGCAVRMAERSGALSPGRLASFLRLSEESEARSSESVRRRPAARDRRAKPARRARRP